MMTPTVMVVRNVRAANAWIITSSVVFASIALTDNVYISETGKCAAIAKNAGAVRACTLARAARVV